MDTELIFNEKSESMLFFRLNSIGFVERIESNKIITIG